MNLASQCLLALASMMNGQILSSVSPITAAHYKLVVMCVLWFDWIVYGILSSVDQTNIFQNYQ